MILARFCTVFRASLLVLLPLSLLCVAQAQGARKRRYAFYALWLALSGLALSPTRGRRIKRAKLTSQAFLLGLFLMAIMLPSCGGGGSNGGGNGSGGGGDGGQQPGTQPGTYSITVIGTSGTLVHQAPSTVTLIVKP